MPTLAAIALLDAGVVEDVGTLLIIEHALMLAGMFGVMLLRPDEYSHSHHHNEPLPARRRYPARPDAAVSRHPPMPAFRRVPILFVAGGRSGSRHSAPRYFRVGIRGRP